MEVRKHKKSTFSGKVHTLIVTFYVKGVAGKFACFVSVCRDLHLAVGDVLCPKGDSNSYTLRRSSLKRVRLPVPPFGHCSVFEKIRRKVNVFQPNKKRYLTSLCNVWRCRAGLYFFRSNRSVVFFLFLVVVYRDAVFPSFFASVHSSVMVILFSFPFAIQNLC